MTAGGPFQPGQPGQPSPPGPRGPYTGPGYLGGAYGPPPTFAAGPPPRGSQAAKLWLAASGLVVVAAVVIIALVLTSGGGAGGARHQAGGATLPPDSRSAPSTSGSSQPTSSASTSSGTSVGGVSSVGPAAGQSAPTDDPLPQNSGTDSCDTDGYSDLSLVAVITVLGLTEKGAQPNSFVANVLRDCTSATVRSRISELYGTTIDYHAGDDLTGQDGRGPTAQYLLHDKTGKSSLKVTLTRQRDGHYEVTAYVYTP